jgi:protein-cysteine N-palmitoyltransferase HHAT
MLRCFANNYDIEGFWKGWHASYNRWLVKYIYVPLGGNRRRALVIWPIFLFVALWHDLEFRLLGWAWLICLAFLPEMAIKALGASARFDQVRESMWFRAVTAAFAAINIAALMMVNMVGFVVGLNGILELFASLYAAPGYVATALFTFYCAAQVLFAWRECPGNKGSYLQ